MICVRQGKGGKGTWERYAGSKTALWMRLRRLMPLKAGRDQSSSSDTSTSLALGRPAAPRGGGICTSSYPCDPTRAIESSGHQLVACPCTAHERLVVHGPAYASLATPFVDMSPHETRTFSYFLVAPGGRPADISWYSRVPSGIRGADPAKRSPPGTFPFCRPSARSSSRYLPPDRGEIRYSGTTIVYKTKSFRYQNSDTRLYG
jgi:hypothetical protein